MTVGRILSRTGRTPAYRAARRDHRARLETPPMPPPDVEPPAWVRVPGPTPPLTVSE